MKANPEEKRSVTRWTLLIAGVAVAAALALTGLILARGGGGGPPAPGAQSASAGAIGGPFRLVDQNGRPVDQHALDGRYSAVFFGYTFCPDTCPATLQKLRAAAERLGPKAERFQAVFITVDPERDSPKQMKTYVENQAFPKRILALTGTPAQIAQAAKAYRVYYAKSGSGPDYSMDHSAAIYLMDPKGRFVQALSEAESPDDLARQIDEAMAKG